MRISRSFVRAAGLVITAAVFAGCPGPPPPPPPDPLIPEDYRDTYTEVRDCRQSGDHDLNMVRVLADPAALAPYQDRAEPFPVGATIVKEQYDFGDSDCSGPIVRWTIMQRLEDGSAPADLDWAWEALDADFHVEQDADLIGCPECHMGCDPPGGYMGTCTEP